ncbi:hypothetical protein [Hydrogenimonas sp.]
MAVRTTITIEEELLKLLKLKAIETSQSVSSLVNEALYALFMEDKEDLEAFEKRKNEETVSYEAMLKELERDGKL